MLRRTWALLAVVALAPGLAAADKAPAGNWKVSLPLQRGGDTPWWLIQVEGKEGAWSGKVLAQGEDVPRTDLSGLGFKDGVLTFTLNVRDQRFSFEVRVPAEDTAKLYGTFSIRNNVQPALLERTAATSLDPYELGKDVVATSSDPIAVVKGVFQLVGKAGFMKARPEEVRGWMDKALKVSEPFGPRWQREMLLGLTEVLNEQDGLAAVALPYARRAERELKAQDRPSMHKRTLDLLAAALERAGKEDEAKEVQARLKKLDYGVRVTAVTPRTGKANRTALVELFTGAECAPCVAADLAFDALGKTYKPSEVILLQYHEHIPGPDPLTNAQTEARMKYYAEAFGGQIRGTPSMVFNGTPGAGGGGGRDAAQDKYDQYLDVIRPLLEQTAGVTLKATAKRTGDKIEIKAEVSDLKDTGDSMRLRLVLVEEQVAYKGGNGLETHHCVVRAFPGGLEGLALKDKSARQSATVDVAELKKELTKYLDDYNKKADDPLPKERPMELKKLRVVALVQDDNTREVLQSVQVDVEDAK